MIRLGPILLALTVCTLCVPAQAEQPIFDEMPRWKGGWGFQFLQEYRTQRGLYDDDERVRSDLAMDAHLFHVQGVYTWYKWIRLTVKAPLVIDAQRTIINGGTTEKQTDSGLGDPTIALPLKKYFNLDGRTGSWGITPQVRIPTARPDEFDVFNRELGAGLSLGYATETYGYIGDVGVTGWYYHGDAPATVLLELDIGKNFSLGSKNGHLKLKNHLKLNDDGELSYAIGPTLYFRITDLVHAQFRSLHDLYKRTVGLNRYGKQHTFRLGLGFVF